MVRTDRAKSQLSVHRLPAIVLQLRTCLHCRDLNNRMQNRHISPFYFSKRSFTASSGCIYVQIRRTPIFLAARYPLNRFDVLLDIERMLRMTILGETQRMKSYSIQ